MSNQAVGFQKDKRNLQTKHLLLTPPQSLSHLPNSAPWVNFVFCGEDLQGGLSWQKGLVTADFSFT